MSLLKQIEDLAIQVSHKIILPNFASVHAKSKKDGSLLTAIDMQAHAELSEQLVKLADFPVLSEEMTSLEQQEIIDIEGSNYWCIDPIDGTSNFTFGVPYWCVSIALILEGQMKLGVVYDPNRNECFSASSDSVTTLNGEPLLIKKMQSNELKHCLALIDYKRLSSTMTQRLVSSPPYRSQRNFGASALDLCWIASQRCQLYLHGGQNLWDHAAGLLILKQAGAKAKTFQGEDVFQNNLQPKSVIAASNDLLMNKWTSYFRGIKKLPDN
ncbi:MAG: inositol monophosphatase family protein [Methylococcaceae bacterium]|nr:inositol monophosphatase family protein [Methylococcaceae bacterium]